MDYLIKLDCCIKQGQLPQKFGTILRKFYLSYSNALISNGLDILEFSLHFHKFLDLVLNQLAQPYHFESFHRKITDPFDYYRFGLDFIRPLIVYESSRILRAHMVDQMQAQLAQGENVILLANHQTEPDPQIISLLLEKTHPQFAEEIIFIAGHRVITDPLAVPFSKGCNLLCIYSKKHVETPPEQKAEKLQHNQRTMKRMGQLLSEGGKCIYVAPSGGRDRPNREGVVDVARFDPQSVEMFWLMAQQAAQKTHFYPLALATYDLLPPPNSIQKELGERRHAQCAPVHLAFGSEIDMENFPGSQLTDKRQKRKLRADYIWELVKQDYRLLKK